MLTKPGMFLHAEGFAVLTVSVAAYHELNGNWLLYFLVFLWPDLFMLGYLANVRLGASLYNLVQIAHGRYFSAPPRYSSSGTALCCSR